MTVHEVKAVCERVGLRGVDVAPWLPPSGNATGIGVYVGTERVAVVHRTDTEARVEAKLVSLRLAIQRRIDALQWALRGGE